MQKIKRINEKNKVDIYDTVVDAAKSVDTRMDLWKVQLLIMDAIIHKKRAFKYKWEKVN